MPEVLMGAVASCRRGPKTRGQEEYLIQFPSVKSFNASGQLIGRKVALPLDQPNCIGKIVASHGKKETVEARFRKGLSRNTLGSLLETAG